MRLRPRNQRGTIIIVAIMVLLALAGLALLSVRASFFEIRTASNHNMARMSYYITEGGASSTVAFAYNSPSSFLSVAYGCGMTLDVEDMGLKDALWDLDPGGSLGFAALGAPDSWTTVANPTTLDFYPGNSVGEFCAEKHLWRTHGSLGTKLTPEQTANQDHPQYGEKVILTRWLIGPIDCVGGN